MLGDSKHCISKYLLAICLGLYNLSQRFDLLSVYNYCVQSYLKLIGLKLTYFKPAIAL